eukprot:COSAG05_NODE_1748_length_4150_cov_2.073068_1_plen_273_part_00
MTSSRVEECIDCMGGNRVFAKSGHYVRKSPNSLRVFRCSSGLCAGLCEGTHQQGCEEWTPELEAEGVAMCSGGSTLQTDGNCCLEGHSGPLCALCDSGWAWSDDRKCVRCEKPDTMRITMILNGFTLFGAYLVLSKHFQFKVKKNEADSQLGKLTDNRWLVFPFLELTPLGLDLPKTQGSELQTLTFWMQTFAMLDIKNAELIQMVMQFSFTKGADQCLFPMEPEMKYLVDVLGPPIHLSLTAALFHYLIVFCYYKAHRAEKTAVTQVILEI